jgi:hypothetical protein
MEIKDRIAAPIFHNTLTVCLQDAIAPFYQFLKVEYSSMFCSIDNIYAPNHIVLSSSVRALMGNKVVKQRSYEIICSDGLISEWKIMRNNQTILTARCINEG